MEPRLLALKLVLDRLGVPASVETLSARTSMQKAIYLSQRSGLNLGYSYGWYLKGPYSPRLADDYYALTAVETAGTSAGSERELVPAAVARLEPLLPLMRPRPSSSLSQSNWLELLASYHYLRVVSGLDHDRAVGRLREQKPHLVDEVEAACAALDEARLLEV